MKISRRSRVPTFAVMDILAEAKARAQAGESIVSLCVGEPVTGASEVVRSRATELLAEGDLGYTEALGAPALRIALAQHYHRWYGATVDSGSIAVTTGSSGGFLLAFLAAFDVGDRVALARPGYPAYKNILIALGCEVVEIDCGPQQGYRLDAAALSAASAAGPLAGLIVASPANPTGTMMSHAELAEIARWCADHQVRLVSDEIYHGIVYDQASWPGASAVEETASGAIVVSSFSKYWSMTGWRLGWLVLPDDLVPVVDALAGNVTLCPPALAQYAAIAALGEEGYAAAAADVAGYGAARDVVLAALPRLGWRQVAPPDGAFYLYADITASGMSSPEYCSRLLAEAGVALTPGTDFDSVHGQDWVRVSLAAGASNVQEACARIEKWQRG